MCLLAGTTTISGIQPELPVHKQAGVALHPRLLLLHERAAVQCSMHHTYSSRYRRICIYMLQANEGAQEPLHSSRFQLIQVLPPRGGCDSVGRLVSPLLFWRRGRNLLKIKFLSLGTLFSDYTCDISSSQRLLPHFVVVLRGAQCLPER